MVSFSKYFPIASGAILGGAAFLYFYRSYFTSKSLKLLVDSKVKHPLKIISKNAISHDSMRIRIELPSLNHMLGLPIGNCICLNSEIDGENITRPYTPVTPVDTKGYFDLVIKVYKSNAQFKNGGKMSQYLESCKVGDHINVSGPFGRIKYLGNGDFFTVKTGVTNNYNHVVMIAGGSGITPMLQILTNSLGDKSDKTKFSLIFANKSVDDILLKDELVELSQKHPDRLSVSFVVDKVVEGQTEYTGHVGYITEDVIRASSPVPADNVLVMMCGPKGMIDFISPTITNMGYAQESVFVY